MFSGMNYVYEVYKEQSFSKAAENLYISQPALSSMIKKIETKIYQCDNKWAKSIFMPNSRSIFICIKEFIYFLNIETNPSRGKRTSIIHPTKIFFVRFICPDIFFIFEYSSAGVPPVNCYGGN